MKEGPEPIAMNRMAKLMLYDDGVARPFVNMFDADGDETDDPALALAVVVRVADDHWNCVELKIFDETTVWKAH